MSQRSKIMYAMVSVGPGSAIGSVHLEAAAIDGMIDLFGRAFSSSPEKSYQAGKEL